MEILGRPESAPVVMGAISHANLRHIQVQTLTRAMTTATARAQRGAPGWEREMYVRNWLETYIADLEV